MALALGMCQYQPAATELESYAQEFHHIDQFCGYLCISIALLGAPKAADSVREIAIASPRRPLLLQQAVIALGALRDRAATKTLVALLKMESASATRNGAIAAALGMIDDPNAVPDLIEILKDPKIPDINRASAAAALGGMADPDPLPFYWRIANGLNYRAAVPTLVSGCTGLLERL
jgi:HEAT repeat protein